MRARSRTVMAVAMFMLMTAGGPAAVFANDPLWTESQGASTPPELARLNDLLYNLANRLKPALIQVRAIREREAQPEGSNPPGGPSNPPGGPSTPPGGPRESRTNGSGFIIRQDGYLVTNTHVVKDADRILVRLADGRSFSGRVVGQDTRVDLALIKIEASGLPVAALGDSNRLRVGEFVMALGHPFGLEQTVSFGIVSRKGAPLEAALPGFDFIQTDAAVNPGNSGGPLINMAGEVVGINSMATRNGSIGFAIPVNLAKGLLPQLAEKGKVEWGWLGVRLSEITPEDAPKYGLTEARGILIQEVMAGQPADLAGVKASDVVLSVDGTEVRAPKDLQRIISSTPAGQTVTLKVMRDGKPTEMPVTVGQYREERAQAPAVRRPPAPAR
jgi:serine protease Do